MMQIRIPLKIAVKSRDVVVDIQKRVSTVAITIRRRVEGIVVLAVYSEKSMCEL